MFLKVARLSELMPGFRRVLRHQRHTLFALVDEHGDLHVLNNACPHQGFPLDKGQLGNNTLSCPRHGFIFRLDSGACQQASSCQLEKYPLHYEGQWVGVLLSE